MGDSALKMITSEHSEGKKNYLLLQEKYAIPVIFLDIPDYLFFLLRKY